MRLPNIRGIIDRRILVNFRVDPEVISKILPSPFRPQLVNGHCIAGICLIRLKQIRPSFLPWIFGVSSENAAHRIAVEWDVDDETRTGVYVPRRDTSSWLNSMAGGRLFPGRYHRASFEVEENEDHFHVAMESNDGAGSVKVSGDVSLKLASESTFESMAEISQFFASGCLGYSPNASGAQFDGMELCAFHWHVDALDVTDVDSSFFDDRSVFPKGSVAFDSALLMRDIEHEWRSRGTLNGDSNSSVDAKSDVRSPLR